MSDQEKSLGQIGFEAYRGEFYGASQGMIRGAGEIASLRQQLAAEQAEAAELIEKWMVLDAKANAELAAERERREKAEAKLQMLRGALDTRDLFINPDSLNRAADEIDCDRECESGWYEYDTGAGGCHKSDRGEYCRNDVAETLRAIAVVSRHLAALSAPAQPDKEETE
jgi:hypothetical protein